MLLVAKEITSHEGGGEFHPGQSSQTSNARGRVSNQDRVVMQEMDIMVVARLMATMKKNRCTT
jgi:hypothetical protein